MCSVQDLNIYTRLLKKVNRIKADIIFLKECKQNQVFPSFMNIKCKLNNARSQKCIRMAKQMWLKEEMRHHYGRLDFAQLKLYETHLKLSRDNSDDKVYRNFSIQMRIVHERVNKMYAEKRATQTKKLTRLIRANDSVSVLPDGKPKVQTVDGLVVNLSSESFSKDEMDLLNRGLNFSVQPMNTPYIDIIADIETAIQYKPFDAKIEIRKEAEAAIVDLKRTNNNKNDKIANGIWL